MKIHDEIVAAFRRAATLTPESYEAGLVTKRTSNGHVTAGYGEAHARLHYTDVADLLTLADQAATHDLPMTVQRSLKLRTGGWHTPTTRAWINSALDGTFSGSYLMGGSGRATSLWRERQPKGAKPDDYGYVLTFSIPAGPDAQLDHLREASTVHELTAEPWDGKDSGYLVRTTLRKGDLIFVPHLSLTVNYEG